MPLPPLPEQRAIAALLTEQLAAVERARAAVEVQLRAARALPGVFPNSTFTSAIARRWPIVPLGEIGTIGSGITLGRKLRDDNVRRVPYLRVANVKDGCLEPVMDFGDRA